MDSGGRLPGFKSKALLLNRCLTLYTNQSLCFSFLIWKIEIKIVRTNGIVRRITSKNNPKCLEQFLAHNKCFLDVCYYFKFSKKETEGLGTYSIKQRRRNNLVWGYRKGSWGCVNYAKMWIREIFSEEETSNLTHLNNSRSLWCQVL